MVWTETCLMQEKARFCMAYATGETSMSELCRRFGVSRKTGYRVLARWRWEGAKEDQGASAADRAADGLAGCEHDRGSAGAGRSGGAAARTAPFADCRDANDTWSVDFKGWFRTGDGASCDPLTIQDQASRYLIRAVAVDRMDGAHVWPVLDAAFREFGLPRAMRSDNGVPFASCAPGGLSALSVRLVKAGVVPERIDPASPQQNGRLERLHLTLAQGTARPPAGGVAAAAPRSAHSAEQGEKTVTHHPGQNCYPSSRLHNAAVDR